MDVTYKRGDTYPPLRVSLTDIVNAPMNLTGATVKLILRKVGGDPIVFQEFEATPVGAPTLGVVQVEWEEDDLAETGYYLMEWEVTGPVAGQVESFPGEGYEMMRILPDLNPSA